jgi:hypothetical protein
VIKKFGGMGGNELSKGWIVGEFGELGFLKEKDRKKINGWI